MERERERERERDKFCVINVKYKEISWRVRRRKKRRKKVTSRSKEFHSCLKIIKYNITVINDLLP